MHLEPRRDLYRVLGALALAPPTDALLSTLASSGAFAALQQHAPDAAMRDALGLMATDLARGEAHYPEVRRDHIALFVGPKKKLAPPWESVYRSTDRLVMQEQAAEVLRAYATHRIGFEGMGRLPADHAGYELEFVSILLDRSVRSEKARAAIDAFLREHLLAWVPQWSADIEKHATSNFMLGFGRVLASLCAMERAAHATPPAADAPASA